MLRTDGTNFSSLPGSLLFSIRGLTIAGYFFFLTQDYKHETCIQSGASFLGNNVWEPFIIIYIFGD